MRAALLALGLLVVAAPAAPQARGDSATFLDAATDAARRYRDQRTAVAEGYRRVGPDFPAMGEHWVQPGRLVSGRLDPAAPPILSYVSVDGGPVLVGVAYAIPLRAGEPVPDFPLRRAWHDHSGSVDEESLLITPHLAATGPGGPRLAMLHAWTEVPNPAGVFAQHNWALPFTRAGLRVEGPAPEAAARAVSLANGGDAYYHAVVEAACAPDAATEARVAAALGAASRRVATLVPGPGGVVDPALAATLAATWGRLLAELAAALPPDDWIRLRPLLDPAHAGGH